MCRLVLVTRVRFECLAKKVAIAFGVLRKSEITFLHHFTKPLPPVLHHLTTILEEILRFARTSLLENFENLGASYLRLLRHTNRVHYDILNHLLCHLLVLHQCPPSPSKQTKPIN